MSIIWVSSRLRNFLLRIERSRGEGHPITKIGKGGDWQWGGPPVTGDREENIKQMETTSSAFLGCEHAFFLPPTNRDSEELPSNSNTAVKKHLILPSCGACCYCCIQRKVLHKQIPRMTPVHRATDNMNLKMSMDSTNKHSLCCIEKRTFRPC